VTKALEDRLPRWHRTRLTIVAEAGRLPTPAGIAALAQGARFGVRRIRRAARAGDGDLIEYEVAVLGEADWQPSPAVFEAIAAMPEVQSITWRIV
jgi:HEAT repeat protein